MWTWTLWTLMGTVWSSWSRGWIAAGIRSSHNKELTCYLSTFRNAELLYIIEAARKQREEEDLAAGGEK